MPEEHDRWLDRETAERLLRGERLGADDPGAARDLARMLDSLSAAPADPAERAADFAAGEDAALAAFRAARTARGAAGARRPDTPGAALPPRARRGRGAARRRFALAAVLVTGVVGGGAAIGGGLHGFVSGDRAPAGSVATGIPAPSGTSTPVPLGSESPAVPLPGGALSGVTDGSGALPSPGGTSAGGADGEDRGTSGAAGHGDASDAPRSGDAHGGKDGKGTGGQSGDRGRGSRESLRDACRDHLAGRSLTAEQRRKLDAAAGSAGVSAYCAGLVGDGGEAPADGTLKRDDDGDDRGKGHQRERDDSAENGRRTVGGPAAGEHGRGAGGSGAARGRGASADDRASRPTPGSPAGSAAERGSGRERAAEPATAGRRG
ncbi:hypothetical protein [Streptomyces sp. NPDC056600]|uniref:hypothetical protein n=1 Tax=Streptomyces sp. NPDC056600 TaxID=3345874 RepID=UPI0036781248